MKLEPIYKSLKIMDLPKYFSQVLVLVSKVPCFGIPRAQKSKGKKLLSNLFCKKSYYQSQPREMN